MDVINQFTSLVVRQAAQADPTPDTCEAGNSYDGRLGLRIASIFIIGLGSTLGAVFPVFAKQNPWLRIPDWAFFVAKYFGSGVIIATAFIHLLGPAEDALRNPCLTGPITSYGWVEGIVLMTIFVLFFIELMVMRYGEFGSSHEHEHNQDHSHSHSENSSNITERFEQKESTISARTSESIQIRPRSNSHQPGEDHLGHHVAHTDIEDVNNPFSFEEYSAQLTALFILEFGVIFHSVFIGLTLAVSGDEFITLFIVLVFHQTFEGLGLGSRLAVTPWPRGKRMTPYVLALAYGFSTPIAIAIGLGVRKSYPPGGRTTLIVNGVFDSISAGILIYTGLVELMAHEFMFSNTMRQAKIGVVLAAFGMMCLGGAMMALLGKWA